MVPIIILCGQAGSGKDTAANYLVEKHNAVAIGQADVLKHMARDFFGFTDEQLFGPSEKRNEADKRFGRGGLNPKTFAEVEMAMRQWARRIFPSQYELAHSNLVHWHKKTLDHGLNNGGLSARYVLQTLGTEWGRAIDKQVWTRYAFDLATKLLGGGYAYSRVQGLKELEPGDYTAPDVGDVTDGRFRNEALMARRCGGVAVKLARKTELAAQAEAAGVAGHASEAEVETVPRHFFDYVIKNTGSKAELYGLLERLMFVVKHPPTIMILPPKQFLNSNEHTSQEGAP